MAPAELVFAQLGITVRDVSRCTVVAFGTSDLHLDTSPLWRGTISGQLYVVVNSDRTNLTDAAELVVMTGKFPGTIEVTDPVIITITNGTFKPTGSIGVDDENDWCLGFRICEAPFRGKFRQPFEVDRGAVSKEDSGDLVWVLGRALSTPPCALRSRSSTTNAGGE